MQQQSPTVPDSESFVERRATIRTTLVDGRQAQLADRGRLLPVLILDESTGGFRVAASEVCYLALHDRTTLHLNNGSIRVRLIYKRLEGPHTMMGLQRLPT